jgi:hypothetical protein
MWCARHIFLGCKLVLQRDEDRVRDLHLAVFEALLGAHDPREEVIAPMR